MHTTDLAISTCTWDSAFLGIQTGKVVLPSGDACQMPLIDSLRNNGYKLIYLFSPEPITRFEDISAHCDIIHTDIRHHYRLNIAQRIQLSACIAVHVFEGPPTDALTALAISAAQYSRFQTDKHFPPHTTAVLYDEWLNASFHGAMGDKVLLVGSPDAPDGLITIKLNGRSAHIGLIAVQESKKGKGVGTALVDSAISHAMQLGAETISVQTQAANTQACRFYTHLGFTLTERTWIYHLWL